MMFEMEGHLRVSPPPEKFLQKAALLLNFINAPQGQVLQIPLSYVGWVNASRVRHDCLQQVSFLNYSPQDWTEVDFLAQSHRDELLS